MAISIKTSEDIEKMRVAGRLAAEVLEMIEPYIKTGRHHRRTGPYL
ncbi:methionine aminopeptidase [Salmonella enterica subsp. enterica serovar Typhimurium]|nr:methionine aminopeptidase [Salmonella enterica subsp. enterica serovar Typhimurium]